MSLAHCKGMKPAISRTELHGLPVQNSTFIFNLYSKIIPGMFQHDNCDTINSSEKQ